MARLLVGVSGGIAAYKALECVRLAALSGHAVRVVQTEASQRFVGAASFSAITGAPVLVDEWERDPARGAFPDQPLPEHEPLSHLELVRNADVFLIAPATANTLAKLAHGLSDNLLTAAALAADCPLVVAPAMNNHMYEHSATQANVRRLRERGVRVLEPETGALGSRGEWGVGRLPEPAALLAACEQALADRQRRDLEGLRVLVTAGGTREPVDAVRFVGNRSSGRMGVALAEEALARGAHVDLVAAHLTVEPPARASFVAVETAAQLAVACRERFGAADILLMAAAVADFRPSAPVAGKIKKDRDGGLRTLALEPTEDVLGALSRIARPGQTLVGFAAEHGGDAVAYGRAKLRGKRLDLVVVNDIGGRGVGFDATENEVWLLDADDEVRVERAPKRAIAAAVLDRVVALRARTEPGDASGRAATPAA